MQMARENTGLCSRWRPTSAECFNGIADGAPEPFKLRSMFRRGGLPMVERTLSIVKPDGVKRGLIGEVLKRFEEAKIRVAAIKMVLLNQEQAKAFYAVHK